MPIETQLSDENLILLTEIKKIVGKLYKRVDRIDMKMDVQ